MWRVPAPAKRDGQSLAMGSVLRHEDCWAKTTKEGGPGITVRDHCLNVGCVAEALLALLPPYLHKLIPPGAATLAALHDIGKVSPGFQQKCDKWQLSFKRDAGYEPRHQRISQIFMESLDNGRLRRWAEAVGAHHGRVQGYDAAGDLGGNAWEQARQDLLAALFDAGFDLLPKEDAQGDAPEWFLAGLITLADWLGSDENNFSPEDRGPLDSATQREKADKIVKRLDLAGARPVADMSFEQVFAGRLNGESPRPLQREIIAAPQPVPGVYIIEDVMGSGKTEAALWLAYRLMATGQARGLYFGLPTRVTSDRIHRRVREYLAKVYPHGVEPPLVHGQVWLKEMPSVRPAWKDSGGTPDEDETPQKQVEAVRRWFASSRCGLLAPFAVGTVDQALLGVIAAKWFFLRQFALAGKVVVLDEVHSYDLYTGTLIQHLVKRLCELQATPLILSATLTAKQRANLLGESAPASAADVPYPAITVKTSGSQSVLLRVAAHTGTKTILIVPTVVPDFDHVAIVASQAAKLAAGGRNVVWIRNTVRHAQEAYRMVNSEREGDDFKVGLLHSRFPAFQRASYPQSTLEDLQRCHLHEERWLWMLGKPEPPRAGARPAGCVLVATQVVEQSVDIDADVLITDLAPTDMLLQRLGRLHRHDRGNRGQPTAHLVVPQAVAENSCALSASEIKKSLGSVGWVYAPYVLLRTWKEWQPLRDISLPTGIRRLLQDTYSDSNDDPAGWQELYKELRTNRDRLEKLALSAMNVQGQPLAPDNEGLGTRFSTQRQILLLLVRWVSDRADKAGNPDEIQLLNRTKLKAKDTRQFNLPAARLLHLNAATIPAWWLPKAIRKPLPPVLAQYFVEDVAMAVYLGQGSDQLRLDTKDARRAPVICYHPLEGLWLQKPPDKRAIQEDYDGENEDGMF
jgi:CRISPR-associated endonuclease/helicase Cas3